MLVDPPEDDRLGDHLPEEGIVEGRARRLPLSVDLLSKLEKAFLGAGADDMRGRSERHLIFREIGLLDDLISRISALLSAIQRAVLSLREPSFVRLTFNVRNSLQRLFSQPDSLGEEDLMSFP